MIRPATHDDLADLVEFCLECHASMPWADFGLTMDEDSVINGILDFLESPVAALCVVEIDGAIAGACAVAIGTYPLDRRLLVASEWMWHMRPSFPDGLTKRRWIVRMLDHMLGWARENGAKIFKANTVFMDIALTCALERRGIRPMETACIGRL